MKTPTTESIPRAHTKKNEDTDSEGCEKEKEETEKERDKEREDKEREEREEREERDKERDKEREDQEREERDKGDKEIDKGDKEIEERDKDREEKGREDREEKRREREEREEREERDKGREREREEAEKHWENEEDMPAVLSAYLNVKSLKEAVSSPTMPRNSLANIQLPQILDEKQGLKERLTISAIRNLNNFLGESPFYQPETDRVYWVDILKGTLNYWHCITGQIGRWDLKQRIGCAIPIKNNPNTFVIGATKGLGIFDIQSEKWCHTYFNPEHHLITNRWNDGKCGPDGILWIGSMNGFDTDKSLKDGLREGALYYLDGLNNKNKQPELSEIGSGKPTEERLKKRLDYIGISNGIAWSKSGFLMYYIDSAAHTVSEYHYFKRITAKLNIRVSRLNLIVIPTVKGTPDGCAMDANDNLWIALWNGGAIEQYSTIDGSLLNHVDLPDRKITSLAWFGPNLDKLFVTSAISDSLVEILDDIQKPPENRENTNKGRVYVIDFSRTHIRGLPVNSFQLSEFRG
jgi:sugar lactone lactonase YvrE